MIFFLLYTIIMKTIGSRAEVFHGTAKHTSGGLTKNDLKKNKFGQIVSKKASAASKSRFEKNPALKKIFKQQQQKHMFK